MNYAKNCIAIGYNLEETQRREAMLPFSTGKRLHLFVWIYIV